MEDNNKRNSIKNNTKLQKKSISNYTNQREYSEEFLNSLYANLSKCKINVGKIKMSTLIFLKLDIEKT